MKKLVTILSLLLFLFTLSVLPQNSGSEKQQSVETSGSHSVEHNCSTEDHCVADVMQCCISSVHIPFYLDDSNITGMFPPSLRLAFFTYKQQALISTYSTRYRPPIVSC